MLLALKSPPIEQAIDIGLMRMVLLVVGCVWVLGQDGTREMDGIKLGSQEEMSTREKNSSLVLKSLQWAVKEDLLRETFKEATSVKVLLGDDGKSRGMGFLDFNDVATATRVMEASRGMMPNGHTVIFAYSLRQQGGDRSPSRQGAAAVAVVGSA